MGKKPKFYLLYRGKEIEAHVNRVWPLLADETSYWKWQSIRRANTKYLKNRGFDRIINYIIFVHKSKRYEYRPHSKRTHCQNSKAHEA